MSTISRLIDVVFDHKREANETKIDLLLATTRIDELEKKTVDLTFAVQELIEMQKCNAKK